MPQTHHGVVVCPECKQSLSLADIRGEKPAQVVEQRCGSCGFSAWSGVVWYPSERYEVVGTYTYDHVSSMEPCSCCGEDGGSVVIDSRTEVATVFCDECLRAHHKTALTKAQDVSDESE